MPTLALDCHVAAPVAAVFDVIAHIEIFKLAVSHIQDIEFIGEQRRGVGTRFKETRLVNGRPAVTMIEVTEYTKDQRVAVRSVQAGVEWNTIFTVTAEDAGTRLALVLDAHPKGFAAKLLLRGVMRAIPKFLRAEMESVKAFCEGRASGA